MKKLYINCAIIGISIIFSSVSGMEKKNQIPHQQKPHYILIIKPLGGYIPLGKCQKMDLRDSHNITINDQVNKTIHFSSIECTNEHNARDQRAFQLLKYKPIPTVPLDLFTEENKSYTITKNTFTMTFVSDRVYEENSFIPYNEYWQKALNS